MRNPGIFTCVALAVLLGGCATGPRATKIQASQIPASYTRIANPDTNTVRLQLALRKFVPRHHRGPSVWLAGTMHVGEPEYYHELQGFLDARTVVLYEGIDTESHPHHVANAEGHATNAAAPPPGQTRTNSGFTMQSTLAESLGLVFQLDAIDYDRTNFINSDISVVQIQHLMSGLPSAGDAPTRSNPSFDTLLQVMDGSSFLGSLFKTGLQIIGANPKLQALTKLTLIETVGRINGDFSTLRGLPPDMKQLVQVLIQARNQQVITDLKAELKTLPRSGSVAVFYGTGHMEDMEKRLTRDLNYRPADELWLTAFSVNLHEAGLSPSEVQVMRNLVKWQIDQMQPR